MRAELVMLPEDSSQQKNPSSDPICGYGACDGGGYIYQEKDGDTWAKTCQCIKDEGKKKFLGERFYRVSLDIIEPRSPLQHNLKKILLAHPEKSIFLYGNGGAGKTHFLAAMYNYWEGKKKRMKYLEDGILKDELRNAELTNDHTYFGDLAKDYGCFFLDDVGKAAMTAFHQSALYRFFNELYKQKKYIFITANDPLNVLGANEYWGPHVARRVDDLCDVVEF